MWPDIVDKTKLAGVTIWCVCAVTVAVVLKTPSVLDIEAYKVQVLAERCAAEWTDITNATHCNHVIMSLGRSNDTLGNPVADMFHCYTDSVRFALPVPRYHLAQAAAP